MTDVYVNDYIKKDIIYSGTVTTTTSTVINAAGSGNIRNYLTGIQIVNGAATASVVSILDGATVIWKGTLPATIGASLVIPFHRPLKGSVATTLNVQFGTATTAYVNAQGYQAL